MVKNENRRCYANHSCYDPPLFMDPGDTQPYGFGNGTAHFKWWSPQELGADPGGEVSGSHISGNVYTSGGFLAAFRPFFSEVFLPDEAGPLETITDFRPYEATSTNTSGVARYSCARYTTNGNYTVQRCDPGLTWGGSTGLTRSMLDEMLRFLKKAHFIDRQTALLVVSTQVRNNNFGLRFNARWTFEFTPLSGVLPSYFTETLMCDEAALEEREMWLLVCVAITGWFAALEIIEVFTSIRDEGVPGLFTYLGSLWNVLDWLNFLIFFYVYLLLQEERRLADRDSRQEACTSHLCANFGYFDSWEIFGVARNVKLFLSFCVCIQFLKVIKFTNQIIPKMSLMTRVLAKGAADLVFFGAVFIISMFAFCMLFYLQLGSAVDNYYSQVYSMISLTRALFGDFNFEEILENSNSYINCILFLFYLFVAVFILLALFLSILGESQSAVREDELESGGAENEYGVITYTLQGATAAFGFLLHALGVKIPEPEPVPEEPSSDMLRRMVLVNSLKAFKPNFLEMVDTHIDTFESSFFETLDKVSSKLDERDRVSRERIERERLARKGGGGGERDGDRRHAPDRRADTRPDKRAADKRADTRAARDGNARERTRAPPEGHRRPTPTSRGSPDKGGEKEYNRAPARDAKDAPPREGRQRGDASRKDGSRSASSSPDRAARERRGAR